VHCFFRRLTVFGFRERLHTVCAGVALTLKGPDQKNQGPRGPAVFDSLGFRLDYKATANRRSDVQ
jgi:hypothetical protein